MAIEKEITAGNIHRTIRDCEEIHRFNRVERGIIMRWLIGLVVVITLALGSSLFAFVVTTSKGAAQRREILTSHAQSIEANSTRLDKTEKKIEKIDTTVTDIRVMVRSMYLKSNEKVGQNE